MSRKALAVMAAMLATAAAGTNPYSVRRPAEVKRDDSKYRKMFKVESQLHEFIIHGEAIMARNRKTALKIYANRHKSDFRK